MTKKPFKRVEINQKFNKLTLIKRFPVKLKGMRYVYYGLFQCECGTEKMMLISNVVHNKSKSCGCNYKISNKDKDWGRKYRKNVKN